MSSTTGHVRRVSDLRGPSLDPRMLMERDRLHILTPTGIGEFAWIWSKLQNFTKHPLTFWCHDSWPQRLHQFTSLLGIDLRYGHYLETDSIIRNFPGECSEEDMVPGIHVLQINRHLESGRPLEEWMPWLPYKNPVPQRLIPTEKQDYITVYMASERYSEGNLDPEEWGEMIRDIEKRYLPVRLVGAQWDHEMAKGVCECYYRPQGPHCFCQPLWLALQVMAGGRAVIGLNGGISILSTYMGVPTLEAYPSWLWDLADAWPTKDIEANRYWCGVRQLPEVYDSFLKVALA